MSLLYYEVIMNEEQPTNYPPEESTLPIEEERTTYTAAPPPLVKKKRNKFKLFCLILLTLLAIGATAYSVYAWQQNNDLNNKIAKSNDEIDSLNKENQELQKNAQPKDQDITEELPTGEKLKYKLSEDNSQIIWWSTSSNVDTKSVSITDKRVFTTLTTLAATKPDVVKKACGETMIDGTSISLGLFDYATKTYKNNQYANCLVSLSDEKINSDVTTRTQAKELLATTSANVKRFINESSIIKD